MKFIKDTRGLYSVQFPEGQSWIIEQHTNSTNRFV